MCRLSIILFFVLCVRRNNSKKNKKKLKISYQEISKEETNTRNIYIFGCKAEYWNKITHTENLSSKKKPKKKNDKKRYIQFVVCSRFSNTEILTYFAFWWLPETN